MTTRMKTTMTGAIPANDQPPREGHPGDISAETILSAPGRIAPVRPSYWADPK
jgi:hypothetical protein